MEWKSLPKNIQHKFIRAGGWFGKWQYLYESPKGIISMIKLNKYDYITGKDIYEIYCIDGLIDLKQECDSTERFFTKKDAEKRIKELLD